MPVMRSHGANLVTPIHDNISYELFAYKVDPIHPPQEPCLEAFQKMRLGHGGQNKNCYVTLRPCHEPENLVNASLYTYVQTSIVHDERDLMGDMSRILSCPATDLATDPTAIIFYSIASFEGSTRGAGGDLINQVYDRHKDKGIWLSTLSPLRGFNAWLRPQMSCEDIESLYHDESALKKHALRYIFSMENKVQQFHMKKMGAYIGDINLNANTKNSEDFREGMNVMVNYVYGTPTQREFYRNVSQTGQVTLAPHLHDDVMSLEREGFVQVTHERPQHPFTAKPAMF
jgi:hypothetical protein